MTRTIAILTAIASLTAFTGCQNLTKEQTDALIRTGEYLVVKVVDSQLGPKSAEGK